MKYSVEIEETLSATIHIEAPSKEAAEISVHNAYERGAIILDCENFVGTEFKEAKESEDDFPALFSCTENGEITKFNELV